MLTSHEYSGLEFDWLASDEAGLVAYISSAGYGPVPAPSVADGEILEHVLDAMLTLPVVGAAQPVGGVVNPPDWVGAAERGFYAFDWSSTESCYVLIARPTRPPIIDDIPTRALAACARRVRLSLSLATSDRIAADVEYTSGE